MGRRVLPPAEIHRELDLGLPDRLRQGSVVAGLQYLTASSSSDGQDARQSQDGQRRLVTVEQGLTSERLVSQ